MTETKNLDFFGNTERGEDPSERQGNYRRAQSKESPRSFFFLPGFSTKRTEEASDSEMRNKSGVASQQRPIHFLREQEPFVPCLTRWGMGGKI